ncbi:LysR family transcriptional regulator [Hydrogenophaga sp. BPS33]|uniref:LysR family transcriptional regulator n=1 Tax=Hydrogenophaga sp. BPS33 TaxID=2651974 RepID=UPI00131FF7D2|nr:LysR family transcriptional regulator [Hydrogenophaga sp. BPS33]QHE86401.1 LysR family transcriptional regulator [Hydrogenophaga sp. BPS33]
MNLRQLRYFAAAVEHRSVTRAAERLHVAQPALGQHIRALEAELGVPLLDRHSRGVTATAAGEALYTRSLEIFDLIARTQREVVALGGGVARTITLGLTPSLTLLIGTDLQLAFVEKAPHWQLRIWEEPSFKLVAAVENGELDLALAYDVAPRPALKLRPVLEEELLFTCRPDLAPEGPTVELAYILERQLALGTSQDIGRRALARAAGMAPEALKVRYELQSVTGIRDMLLRGSAASVLPYGSIAQEIRAGRLAGLRIQGGVLFSTLYTVTRNRSQSRASDEANLSDWLLDGAISRTAASQPGLTRALPSVHDGLGTTPSHVASMGR